MIYSLSFVIDGLSVLYILSIMINRKEKDDVVIPVNTDHIQGDTDGDGSVTAKDVEYIKVVLAGEEGYVFDFCDVDGDRSITALDVVLLKNILAS